MGGGRAWPGFEIDDSEPQVHAWREPRGPRSLAAVPVGAGGRRQGIAGLQNDADHPPAHQAPPVWRATRELRDKRGLAVELGGGARGRRGLDGMCTAMKSPTGVEGAGGRRQGLAGLRDRRLRAAGSRMEGTARPAWPAEPGRGAGGRRQGLAGLRDRRLRAEGARAAISRAGRRPPAHSSTPQRNEAATGFPATASSRSIGATQQSGTASDQAVMSTWSSTAARPASRRATGTRNGEQDT